MQEVLKMIDWNQIVQVVWTVVLLPVITYIGTQINEYAKAKKIDRYTDILYRNIINAVKDVYETSVKDLKCTENWNEESKEKVKNLAKTKSLNALTTTAYQVLKFANSDFDEYLDSLIEAALYDLKRKNT